MLFNHGPATVSYTFDDPHLVSAAGLVPVMRLGQDAGLVALADDRISLDTDKGAYPGAKTASLVAGMVAGADSIDDMDLLRHGGMKSLFGRVYAPSTLGSFLRTFTHGHVRQLDAVATRFLSGLGQRAPFLPVVDTSGTGGMVFVDIDDSMIEVASAAKQGAGIGYSKVRGLNALIATASTNSAAPIIIGQRLRRGPTHSVRGAPKLLADSLAALDRIPGVSASAPRVVRADSAYYAADVIKAARRTGADISVTVKMIAPVKDAIRQIPESAWTAIKYPHAIWDDESGTWISDAEVAEIPFTAFTSKKSANQVAGRLIVRRIPELNAAKQARGQETLFDLWRYHGFFTTIDASILDTAAADRMHRAHAIIEQTHAELKAGPLAHMPSGLFQANAAWLTLATIAHNLMRAAAVIAGGTLTRARTPSLRTKLIAIPARIARRARKLILHLPDGWKWRAEFTRLYATLTGRPPPATAGI